MPSTDAGYRTHEEMLAIVVRRAAAIEHRRRRRSWGVAGGAVVAVLALGASVLSVASRDQDGRRTEVHTVDDQTSGHTPTTALPPRSTAAVRGADGWTRMSASPIRSRSDAVSAWTGKELLIWRGRGFSTDACGNGLCGDPLRDDGAAYDPSSDTWRVLPADPMPAETQSLPDVPNVDGVWTGRELVVWGGSEAKGAAYDPAANSWRPIAASPLGPRSWFAMAWTGHEVIVSGGVRYGFGPDQRIETFADGAAYDPATDTWRPIAARAAPKAGDTELWADGRLFVLDGWDQGEHRPITERYDPATDRWTSLSPPPISVVAAVWTGRYVLAFSAGDRGQDRFQAARYDPRADRWKVLPDPPASAGEASRIVWTGKEAVVFGARPYSSVRRPGPPAVAFDPAREKWRALPDSMEWPRNRAAVAWTGLEIILWGGVDTGGASFESHPRDDGARYRW